MHIAKLDDSKLPDVYRLFSCVKLDMQQKNIDQWDDIYPNEALLADDVRLGSAFGLFEDAELVGYIVLDGIAAAEYAAVPWKSAGGKAIMMHRLCILPMKQNRDYAKMLLAFAERHGKENGYSSIRLDVFPKNKASMYLFQSCNYIFKGIVTFRKGEFWCFEKSLE